MSKHTHGPWEWWTSNSWKRLRHSRGGKTVDVLQPIVAPDGHPDLIVSEADMHLISAAPDLLNSLREMKELFRFALLNTTPEIARDGMDYIRYAETAIAKAEGRS